MNLKYVLILLILVFGCQFDGILAQIVNDDIINQINARRALRSKIQSDPHRPVYHFVIPEGLSMPFDPNGGIYWNGKYHLGFIYQKQLNQNEPQHVWGHAVSKDLFHWAIYPDMLEVHENDPEKGIFSGGAFLGKDSLPYLFYHAYGAEGNSVAYPISKDLKKWKKFEQNPILKSPSKGDKLFGKYIGWDPDGWYENGFYYQLAGGRPQNTKDAPPATLWKSEDLLKWNFLGSFIDQSNRLINDFEDISCPDFFKLNEEYNKYMLLFISHQLGTQYYIGDYVNEKFTNYTHGRMNWPGGTFFAPEQLKDHQGRNIIWGWVLDYRSNKMRQEAGWSGTLSMPRVVSLSDNHSLKIQPPEEIELLRYHSVTHKDYILSAGEEKKLQGIAGRALEIKIKLKGDQSEFFGLKVFSSTDGREETVIRYDVHSKELIIDFKNSTFNKDLKVKKRIMAKPELLPEEYRGHTTEQRAPFSLNPGEDLELDVFIDHSIIEVFANDRICMTQRVYPMLPSSSNILLFNQNKSASLHIDEVKAWKILETNYY